MLERLHKVLARAGVAALRPAEDMIIEGRVTVNGRVVRELGARVDPHSDVIAVDGQLIEPAKPGNPHRYVAVYKPIGVVSTARDTHDRPTVVGLVPTDARLFPVGRLDLESEGLLLLTDDGDLAYRLTHPRFEVEKEYRVLLDRAPSVEDVRRWRDGVELDGELTMPAWVEVQERASNGVWVRIVMREGRKRQIRQIAKLLGYDVRRLIRVREGTLGLGELAPGQWRELAPDEVEALRVHVRHVPGPPADEQESRVPTRTPSNEEQADEAGARRPRRIPPRPGFGARGPARRTYAERDDTTADASERQSEPPRGEQRMDSPPQREANGERPRRPAGGEREREPYDQSGARRSYGRDDDARRDDRGGARPAQRRDQGQRESYGRQNDQRGPNSRRAEEQYGPSRSRDEGQRGSYGNRDQGSRSTYGNRDQGSRSRYGRRDEGQRAPYGNRDDQQPRSYGNRNSGPAGGRGPGDGRGRSSLDPRSGRSSSGERSRSSLDPRSGRSSSGERSVPNRAGGIRGTGPARGNTRGPARPDRRDERYGGSQRDERYGGQRDNRYGGGRSSSGGPRSGAAGSGSARRPGYDPNRRPGPPRSNTGGRPGSSGGRNTADGTRRSPGPRPRPNRRPREEENE